MNVKGEAFNSGPTPKKSYYNILLFILLFRILSWIAIVLHVYMRLLKERKFLLIMIYLPFKYMRRYENIWAKGYDVVVKITIVAESGVRMRMEVRGLITSVTCNLMGRDHGFRHSCQWHQSIHSSYAEPNVQYHLSLFFSNFVLISKIILGFYRVI